MADNNVTVDELAIRIAANAKDAATNIDSLTASLERLATTLAPVQGLLARVTKMLQASKGSGAALRQALSVGGDPTAAIRKSVDATRERIDALSATFTGIRSSATAGTTPAASALKQMTTLAAKTNSELVKLKVVGGEMVPDEEFRLLDAVFEDMLADIARLKASLAGVPKIANQAAASFVAMRQTGGQLPNKGFTVGGTFAPTPFVSNAAAQQAAAAAAARTTIAPLSVPAPVIQPVTIPAPQVAAPVRAISRMGTVISNVRAKVASFGQTLRDFGTGGSKAIDSLGGSFIQLRSAVFFALFAIGALVALFKGLVVNASDFIETQNLFQVSLRNNIGAANSFVDSMRRAFGLDPKRIMEYQATFFQIAESMGVTNKNAYALSEVLTRLTFDFASLRNMKLDEVFTKMQAVLTGQDRAIRSLGGSIQMATLQELAQSLGISKNVKDMTQKEKVLLRLIAVYRQSSIAQGDMARTLMQPANLMRVLGDQIAITARAIGALFIPALTAVLPYVIFFVKTIGEAAAALARMFGFSAPTFSIPDISFSDSLADNMASTAGSAGKARDAIKQMRDYTLGIDELNIISPETAAGGGGGGGGGAGGNMGALDDIIEAMKREMDKALAKPFEVLMERIRENVINAMRPLQPFITAIKRVWEALKPFASNVWNGFTRFYREVLIPLAVWTMNTVGVWVLERIRDILEWFNSHPGAAEALGAAIATFTALKGLDFAVGIVTRLAGAFSGLFGLGHLSALLGNVIGGLTTLGGVVGAVFDAFAVGGASAGFATFSAAIGPGGWIVLGVTAVIAAGIALWQNWDKVTAVMAPLVDMFRRTGDAMKSSMAPAMESIGHLAKTLEQPLREMWDALVELGQGIWQLVGPALLGAAQLFFGLANAVLRSVGPIVQVIAGLATIVVANFNLMDAAARGDARGVVEAFNSIKVGAKDVADGVVNGVKEFAKGFDDGVVSTYNFANEFGTNLSRVNDNTTRAGAGTTRYMQLLKQLGETATGTARGIDGLMHSNSSYEVTTRRVTEADIANQRAKLDLKRAQQDYNTAVKTYGKNSDEAKDALLRVRDAELRAADAAADYKAAVKANAVVAEIEKIRKAWERAGIAAANAASVGHAKLYIKFSGSTQNKYAGEQAAGGVIPRGSMFVAGEAGPELVGSFGGNTNTVMPLENSGFVEAMAAATFRAMSAAMSQAGGSGGSGDVLLDGEKVGAVLRKGERRRGVGYSLVTAG